MKSSNTIENATKIYIGNFNYVPEPSSSMVRIFLSSTFSGIY
jgi:hypothetical protein